MSESPVSIDDHGNMLMTGSGIALFRDLSAATNLAMTINSGGQMQLTRSRPGRTPLSIGNSISDQLDWSVITEATGIKAPAQWASKRTKAGALLDLVLFMAVVYGTEPISSVRKALDEKKLATALRKAVKVRNALSVIIAAERAAAGG